MTPSDFIYSANFPGLNNTNIQGGIDAVETLYVGALNYWSGLSEDVRTRKRTLLENLLVAWWLAVTFPTQVRGILSDGGIPVSSKSLGGTSLTYKDIESDPALKPLLSNTFGLQALTMMLTAPEVYAIYG